MQKLSRLLALSISLLAFQAACGRVTPTAPTETAITPKSTDTPAPTPIAGLQGQIAFGTFRNGISQIVLLDLDSGTESALTLHFDGEYSRPVWSPDGQRLA